MSFLVGRLIPTCSVAANVAVTHIIAENDHYVGCANIGYIVLTGIQHKDRQNKKDNIKKFLHQDIVTDIQVKLIK